MTNLPPDGLPESMFRVRTWDLEKKDFTPHEGLAEKVVGFGGLRSALRYLREQGYPCDRSDPSVLVERLPPTT